MDQKHFIEFILTSAIAAQLLDQRCLSETRAALPRKGLILVLHGTDDGLVPMAFNGAPYVANAAGADANVRYWQVRNCGAL